MTRCRTCAIVAARLRAEGIRVDVDESDERMQKKIRAAQHAKVPFMMIAGATDAEAGAVSFRYRDGTQRNGLPIDQAIAEVVAIARDRVNLPPTADMWPSDSA